jgi:hypothetical protein
MQLEQLHTTLREKLLAIEGVNSQPYQTKTGVGPQGGIEDFTLKGKSFVGMRRTDKYIMLYVGPILDIDHLADKYQQSLAGIRSGKGCLKITKPDKTDLSPVLTLFTEAAANWD